jgi:small GTP-binding protein
MEVVNSIIYIDVGVEKPILNFWYPHELPESVSRLISQKCYSIISEDDAFIPEVLLIFPITSFKLKALIKYFKREKPNENGYTTSVISFLFAQEDDNVFYRYMSYLDSYFTDTVNEIIKLESEASERERIYQEIVKLQQALCNLTEYLRSKSDYVKEQKDLEDIQLDFEPLVKKKYKVVVMGDPSVGKTSTILRFTDNVFLRAYIPTMGLNITQKIFKVEKNAVELVLWDIGGQTKFELIRKQFYEGLSVFLLIFDITSPKTFANVPKWYQDIKKFVKNTGNEITGYLIGNKIDLYDQRYVSEIDAKRLANVMQLKYLETSALTGANIERVFHEIATKLLEN